MRIRVHDQHEQYVEVKQVRSYEVLPSGVLSVNSASTGLRLFSPHYWTNAQVIEEK